MLHVSAPHCALSGPHRRPGSSRCLVTAVRVVCAGRNAACGDSHRGGGGAHLNPTAMSTKPQQHCRSGWTPSIGQNRVPLPGCRDMQSSVSSQARHGRALKTPRVRAPRAQALCKPTVTLRRLLSTAQHRTHRRARGKPGAHHVATPNFSPQTQVTQKGRGATPVRRSRILHCTRPRIHLEHLP